MDEREKLRRPIVQTTSSSLSVAQHVLASLFFLSPLGAAKQIVPTCIDSRQQRQQGSQIEECTFNTPMYDSTQFVFLD
jgi:hypothetical protein